MRPLGGLSHHQRVQSQAGVGRDGGSIETAKPGGANVRDVAVEVGWIAWHGHEHEDVRGLEHVGWSSHWSQQ